MFHNHDRRVRVTPLQPNLDGGGMKSVEIRAVKNGFIVSHHVSGGTSRYYGEGHHVFNNVEDLNVWLKDNLKPEMPVINDIGVTPGWPECCSEE